ncbi:hypothetical protein EYF80_059840 [Liparis tanakae]|uniref:Uncharacterized protein n=1 Tax=Liparis tanakae TaxID=230148 RepID=A0A4Z2EN49_9TELE|nr:hypothetical protein EYF80_059840 [Liparis tanakae]
MAAPDYRVFHAYSWSQVNDGPLRSTPASYRKKKKRSGGVVNFAHKKKSLACFFSGGAKRVPVEFDLDKQRRWESELKQPHGQRSDRRLKPTGAKGKTAPYKYDVAPDVTRRGGKDAPDFR